MISSTLVKAVKFLDNCVSMNTKNNNVQTPKPKYKTKGEKNNDISNENVEGTHGYVEDSSVELYP